jgi:hypothetical protein
MCKNIYYLLLLIILASCSKQDSVDISEVFIGKLVKKGICLNYVIEVNDPTFPQDMIELNWVDASSGKNYSNVFTLKNICSFPSNIDEEGSFKFFIENKEDKLCRVCLAFTPVPSKFISITVTKLLD